uniref:Uncharacterized protein n=1 Tax=Anguilla anguilla TaxID=7936 RepID=A0A0E9R911_ANGAN
MSLKVSLRGSGEYKRFTAINHFCKRPVAAKQREQYSRSSENPTLN